MYDLSDRGCGVWHAQIEERFSPAWWFADVANEAIGSMQHLESVLPLLRQVIHLTNLPCSWTFCMSRMPPLCVLREHINL